MGHTKGGMLEYLVAKEWGERSRLQIIVGFGVRFGEGLESLVSSETVT